MKTTRMLALLLALLLAFSLASFPALAEGEVINGEVKILHTTSITNLPSVTVGGTDVQLSDAGDGT